MTPDASPPSSPNSPLARRLGTIAAALGVVALLAAVGLLSRRSDDGAGSGESISAAAAPVAGTAPSSLPGGSGASAAAGFAEQKAPRFTPTTCWQDLERFNDTVTLGTFREWAAPLIASKDKQVIAYLKERLAELIGNDEGRANEVLAWALEAPGPEFKVLMGGLRGSEALRLPGISEKLVSLGLDEKIDQGRRAGFLDELQRVPRLEPAQLERLTHFAKDAASGEAGWVTTRAIGRVMQEDFQRTGHFKPYLDKLLTLGAESQDEPVRYLALEMEMHADMPLDAQGTAKLGKLLATEGSGEVRQVAAHALSLSEDKKQALDIYARAFAAEREVCVRWALFRFAARAAGKDALPVLADMALADPRFQGDYQDFERLYASGVVDFDRIWFGLPSQDPHGCLDHHDG